MEALEAGLASLELSDSVNYPQTAKEYGVDPTTLRRRNETARPVGTRTPLNQRVSLQMSRNNCLFADKETFRASDPS